ncbi:MAG: RNA polymerase sigma factor [Deltaproteobacteria bacterium]|nr:RNA polymerase sigma factor [Deltaproteobacteria bacterium]
MPTVTRREDARLGAAEATLPTAARNAGAEDASGQALLVRWRAGDASAFPALFRAYRSLVFGVLHHLLPSDPEIEDVVQLTFIEIFRSLDRFEGRSKLSSWIARVALHVGYHHLRRRRSRPADYRAEHTVPEIADESVLGDPEAGIGRHEAMTHVQQILEAMPEKKRTVFLLNDLQGMSQEDVAEVVGTNIATVRTRLFYARKEFWAKAAADPVLQAFCATSGS